MSTAEETATSKSTSYDRISTLEDGEDALDFVDEEEDEVASTASPLWLRILHKPLLPDDWGRLSFAHHHDDDDVATHIGIPLVEGPFVTKFLKFLAFV